MASESSFARMSEETKAHCYTLLNPPKGQKPLPFNKIAGIVKKTDGHHPNESGVRQAVAAFQEDTRPIRKLSPRSKKARDG